MSRDRKRQLNWYQINDCEAVARHLERYYEKHSPRQAGPAAAPQHKRRA